MKLPALLIIFSLLFSPLIILGGEKCNNADSDKNAKIEKTDEKTWTKKNKAECEKLNGALFGAVWEKDLDKAWQLIEKGASVHAVGDYERTPLNLASITDQTEMIKLLLKNGSDPNHQDQWKMTPLHFASYKGNVDAAALLIKAGANLELTNDSGETPVFLAVQRDNMELAFLYLKSGADASVINNNGESLLLNAAKKGNLKLAHLFLKKGNPVDKAENTKKQTALHIASLKGYDDVVKTLLKAGADPALTDAAGNTPLFYAMQYHHRDSAVALAEGRGDLPSKLKNVTRVAMKTTGLDQGDAEVIYTGHSGWAVKTKNRILVFDYYKPDRLPTSPLLANGCVDALEVGNMPVTFLVSHDHGDHYDKATLKAAAETLKNVDFVFGFKADENFSNMKNFIGLKPNTATNHGDMKITTISSIDTGVGFLVEVDGLKIFHAGDHANLNEEEKDIYFNEIKYLVNQVGSADIAFLPVSGCPSRWKPESVEKGFFETIKMLQVKTAFPMHGFGRESTYLSFRDKAADNGVSIPVECAEYPGDLFQFSNAARTLVSN